MKGRQERKEADGMKDQRTRIAMDQPAVYQIQVQGLISQGWLDYFDDICIAVEGEDGWATTTLTGRFTDQAALQGLLQKLYNLGLVLFRVERKES